MTLPPALQNALPYWDLLLDPLALGTGDVLLGDLAASVSCIHLNDPMFADVPEQAPLLVRLQPQHGELLQELTRRALQEAVDTSTGLRSVCGFLQSTLDQAQLAEHLARAMTIRVANQTFYFRYFDPRVMFHLPRLLPRGTYGRLLQGVSQWGHFSWDGHFVVHQVPSLLDNGSPHEHLLSRVQWSRLGAIEHFNATVRLLADGGTPWPPARTEELFAQVLDAISIGLRKPSDTAFYVVCSRRAGLPLARHPRWAKVAGLLTSDVPLEDAVKILTQLH